MADIRIKDLTTTAAASSADDYIAVDGTSNGTRKLSAATPSFATSVTVPDVVGPTSTDLTLTGGSSGASLVLGATTSGNLVMSANSAERARLTSTGNLLIGTTTDAASLAGGLVVNGSGAGAAASSTTTGALRVTGGVGVSGAVYAGGNLTALGTATIGGAAVSDPLLVTGGGGGNIIFRLKADQAFYLSSQTVDPATAGATLKNSVANYFRGGYWNGSASVQSDAVIQHVITSTTPTSKLTFQVPAGTETMSLASSGAATFAGVVIKKNYTVATLPAAASYTYGEAYVSDATQAAGTSLGSAPTGGGSVKRGVYSDGSSWLLR